MRRGLALSALLVVLVGLLATPAQAKDPKSYRTHLAGSAEVPAVDTQAVGQATLKVSADGTALDYRLIVANIENVTQAHIHCGATNGNGPVVAFLFGFVGNGVSHNGVLATGSVTGADVIPAPGSTACPGGVADLDELLAKVRSGEAYVNVHTTANPGGEIRGQLRGGGPR